MADDPVVIISPAIDEHARAVHDRLIANGTNAVLLDIGRFPEEMRITLGENPLDIEIDGKRLTPRSVYLRDLALDPGGYNANLEDEMKLDWRRTMAVMRERSNFLLSILYRWEQARIPVYNPLSAFERITKPYQLALLHAAGLPVPATQWTNDPDAVRRFATARRLIYKPVAGGAATKRLDETDLMSERLDRLRHSPVCFQELLPGTDLRVYVIDGHAVASIRILTEAIDFRQNELAVEPFAIDDEMRDVCARAVTALGLRYTGMDLKLDADGRPKILELNPCPMFLGFDARAGTDILGALCSALASGSGSR